MKRLILFGELLCINETLSERKRLQKLLETVCVLLNKKMSLEDIWKFYQKRRSIYSNISIGLLFVYVVIIYHVYLYNESDLIFMFPYLSICYLCTMPLVMPERKYNSFWDNKEEFVSLIRSNNIDQYLMEKNNFWNVNKSNNMERVLTLSYKYKFNVAVLEKKFSPRERQIQKLLKASRLGGGLYRDIYPDEIINNIDKFQLTLTDKNSGETYDISLKVMLESILRNVKDNNIELNIDSSFEIEIKKIKELKNSFNHVPMENIIIYFDFIRKNSKRRIEGFEGILISDKDYLRFIKDIFVDNKENVFFNFKLPAKMQDQKIKALFYKFYEYNREWAILDGAPHSEYKQEKAITLLSRTFERFKDYNGYNFKPRNYHELRSLIDNYLIENDIELRG